MIETAQPAAATPQPAESTATAQAQTSAAPQQGQNPATSEQGQNPQQNGDQDVARQFAALTRKQKELFAKEQAIAERQKKYEEIEALESLRETNPLEYLKKKGMKFEDIMQKALKEGEEPTVEEKLAALEKRLADEAKAREEEKKLKEENDLKAKQEAEQKFIDDFKKKIETDLKADVEKYELINTQNAFGLVYSVIEENWETNRTVMPIHEAAEKVEDYLLGEAKKLLALKKLGISSAKPDPVAQIQTKVDMPTLNSSVTPTTPEPKGKYLSDEESLAEAAKLLKWN